MEPMNQRTEFVLRALGTDNFRALCEEYEISTKTGYKWKERFLKEGLNGMGEHSRRPRKSPKELSERVVCEIVRLKQRHSSWGPKKLRHVYARLHQQVPSESSFKRVLERAGMVEHRRMRRRQEAGRLYSGRKATAANEIWTVDFKGWWYGGEGQRCEPLTVRDEYSRYVLELRAVANARTETVRDCFEELFRKHGLPGAIRSDNGPPFASIRGILGLSRLSAWWVVLGIDLERGRPGCPQDNGAHERLHLDVQRELRGQKTAEHQAGLDEWRHTFNHERPHEALRMKTPAQLFGPSLRKYEQTPDDLSYDTMEPRRVHECGHITWRAKRIQLSKALAGWSVGLEPASQKQWNVWFGKLLLGQVEPSTCSFIQAQAATEEEKT